MNNGQINISVKNVITFKRLKTAFCIGYDIYRYDENKTKYYVDRIIQPAVPCKVKQVKSLHYNKSREWKIDDDIVSYTQGDISVKINGTKISPNEYTLYSKSNTLIIHTKINESDNIIFEYFADLIEYIDICIGKYEYKVEPIFKEGYQIGRHTVLEWRK